MRMNKQELEALKTWVESVVEVTRHSHSHPLSRSELPSRRDKAWEDFCKLMTRSPIEPQINEPTTKEK